MNINRQAGRRRGRGGQRQNGGNPNNGNRIDNRARGNASQLLEKYKALAAEAQRQGDRVNTEYYLQFADHYFRVLAETRSRFEEQNPQRRGREDGYDGEDEGFDEDGEGDGEIRAEPPRRETRGRDDRGGRDANRDDRGERNGNRYNGNANGHADNDVDDAPVAEDRPQRAERFDRAERPARDDGDQPRRGLRPRREPRAEPANEGEAFDAALLPPSLGISVGDEGEPAPEPKPRRRRARPAAEADAAE